MQNINKGFTLIELMITIAILAILAAIAIPAYTGYVTTAKLQEASSSLTALRIAQEEYFMENNKYFSGGSTSAVKTASDGLWSASKGSDNAINFNYVVTTTATSWSAIATGNVTGSSIYGEKVKASK